MTRPIHVRLILALTLAVSFGTVGLVANGTSSENPVLAPVAAAEPAPAMTLLPTVVVRAPAAEIPTLPTVLVRADIDTSDDVPEQVRLVRTSGGGSAIDLPDVLPHVRLDMPYYSFGKLMPRAIKE